MTLEQRARSLAQYAASCCQWLHDGTPRHYTDRCEARVLAALREVEREALERAANAGDQLIAGKDYGHGCDERWTSYVCGRRDATLAIRALINAPASEAPDQRDAITDLRNWAMDLASSEDPDEQTDARKLISAANEIERLRAVASKFPTPINILEYGPKTASLSLTFRNESDRSAAVAFIREAARQTLDSEPAGEKIP